MALINNTFSGKLNLDNQAFRIQNQDFVDALNITRDSPGDGEDVVITNIIGNQLVSYELPPGSTNKVIGKFPDKIRNRVYIFVWCSNNQDLILYYDRSSGTIIKLIKNMVDTDGDVLNFNPSKRINHIDIIYDDQNGDLIFWTDGNTTPKKFNVSHILNGDYTTIKEPFIEVAKAPFLAPVTCVCGSDATRNSNSLRRTLFQFCVRPQYDDFEKGCLFSFSKVPLPIGFYGSDNDIDNTKNNFITINLPTGDENVIALELCMRYSIGNAWSDVVLVAALNKEQLNIPNNSTYQFLFYNDLIYPVISDGVQYVDGVQVIPLFFWVPQLAYAQAIANGNVPVYGAITEGYNNFPINELDVTITAENQLNSPPDTDPPAITYVTSPGTNPLLLTKFTFTVSGTVPTGTFYSITIFKTFPPIGPRLIGIYTSLVGNTVNDVALGLYNSALINAPDFSPAYLGSDAFTVEAPIGSFIQNITVTSGGGGGGGISTEKTWMQNCPYAFGLVYFDEQGRDIPGVITFSNPVDSDNDFLLTTPSFETGTGERKTPVISASINHLPPESAVKYCWVRRRLQYSNWLEYETCDFQDPSDGFYYLCLNNIEQYKEDNSQFIYSTAPITEGGNQRIKILDGITADQYDGNTWGQDFQILGTVTRTLTGGLSPANDKLFIKIKAPASAPSPVYQANMLVMVYTPIANPTTDAQSVYYEWGETFDIYELDGVNYHRGGDQDQTGSQPATFTWEEGDVYYHVRTMYNELLSSPYADDTVSVMDENFSDFFNSAVNDNGRAQAIEVNAKQVYNPVLYRFGGAYQSGTTVNNTPDFYFENFAEADRQYGDIRKFFIRDRYLRVYQRFKVGIIPILLQIVRDTSGNPLEANSDQLLNKINYPYAGNYGIGDVPESFAADNFSDYFIDNNRGIVCRLSQDGIIPLSILYECNSFFVTNLKYYGKNNGFLSTGNPSVNGVFDASTNKYIIALEKALLLDVMYVSQSVKNNDVVNPRYNMLLAKTPRVGDVVTLTLVTGGGTERVYNYTVVAGNTLTDIAINLRNQINADIYFTAILNTILTPQIGLAITQDSITDRDLFTGDTEITYGESSFTEAKTISFNEVRGPMEGFETFLSYDPEAMVCIETQLIAFKIGETWQFTSDAPRCNFFGIQYDASITTVFNDNSLEKKTWQSITELASDVWECPEIYGNLMSYGTTRQQSKLIPQNFSLLEGDWHSSILRDQNSPGGWISGSNMKGNYLVIKFLKKNASELIYLNGTSVKYADSPLTNK